MSNRFEQEFPRVAWQALPPLGPGAVPPELRRQHLERGRQRHSRAPRDRERTDRARVVRRLVALAILPRYAAHALAMERRMRACWAGSARGA
jgi:hypothetical protein